MKKPLRFSSVVSNSPLASPSDLSDPMNVSVAWCLPVTSFTSDSHIAKNFSDTVTGSFLVEMTLSPIPPRSTSPLAV